MSVHQIISTDVIYKAVVKKEDAYLRLSQFAEMIQSFNSGESSIDSVRTYLGLSRNCHEILELIQNFANTSAKDAAILISICTSILVRITNDLKNFHSIAVSLVAEILNFGYKTLHNFLKVSQKPLRMQTTLHLLSAMAAQGPQAARDVFLKMGFASGGFVHLLNKCNQVKDDDVRTSYLNLIVLLLSIGDNNLVRQILETKGFLNGIFPGLPYDRPSVIILVLETFLSKIINNSSIAKTSKIRLFNDYTLKFVINLYDWKGTSVRQQKSLKRKLGEDGDEFRVVEASEEVITSVHEIAHKFLLEVCCSFKNGIVFHDDNSGTSGRNQNHIITNMLKSLLNPHLHPLKSEFLTSVLKVCPGQIKHYLPTLNDSLSPRLSVPWVRAMELLKKIIKAQDYVSVLFESGEKTAVTKLVLMAKDMMFPEVISVSHFTKSLKDDHSCVCYHLASYVCCSLQYVKQIRIYCNYPSKSCLYSFVELQDFYSKFTPFVEKTIPEFKSFQDYWDRLINMKDFDLHDDANLIANGVEVPSLKAQLSQILDIFKNYHEVFPGTELSNDFYQNIFCGLKRIQKELLDTKDCILQLELLDFISTCRSNKTAINIQNEDFSPMSIAFDLFLIAKDFQIKARITNIILKLLPNIHSLDIRDWEINIWLQYIKTDDSSHQKVLVNFFEEMLKIVAKQDQTWINNIKEDKKPRCSNLVFAALVSLSQDHEYVKLCIAYVESVLKNIMFHQAEPNQLFSCIENVCEKISESTVSHWKMISYFKECKTKKTKLTHGFIKKPTSCSEALQNIFISFNFNVKNTSKAMAHFAELFENIQCSDFVELENLLWQLLLYIDLEVSHILETTFNDKTNIPFYVSTVKQLISKVDAFDAEEASNGKQYRRCIVENVLSHHTMIKCFLLVHDDAILKQNYEDVLTLTHLIFSVLSEPSMHNTFSDNESLLLPFKKKVVAFCETYMVNFDCNSVHSTLLWNIVKTLVTDFSSMFSCENVIILLEKFSSLGHERFQDLDPKLRVLSKVIDIYCKSNDFFLLSSECARTLICKYLNCKRKKRATIIKLLKKHPVYSLTLKSDDVHQLVAQQSLVNLELLDILICYNTEIRRYVQNFILTNVGDSEGENEFFLGIIGTVASHNSVSSKKSKNVAFLTSVAQDYWRCFCSILRHIDEDITHSATNIDCMLSLLETHQLIAENQIQEVLQILLQESPVSLPSNSKVDILLGTIRRWRKCWPADCVCTVIMNWMNLHFKSRKPLDETLLKFFLDSVHHFDDSVIYEHFKNSSEWHNFMQIALKAAFRKTDCGVSILTLLMCICKKLYISTEEKLETRKEEGTQVVFTFLTGHSNFFPIMLDGSDQNKLLKGSVISLLTVLVNANASLCKSTHIPLLLASFTSSLSINDRKLLYLLKLYEDAGINMGDFSPFMWGTSAMAHYSMNKNVQFSLWKQPKMREILSLFQKDTLYFLTLNFPLDLKLEMEISEQEESECCGKMYDPRFVLHIASVLLSPGAYVNCREFIESGVLGVVFRSLSSDDSSMRALGYYCLSQFYSHLQSVRSKQSQVWIALLDSIRYSIEKPNPRIPSIVTLFLAKAVNILTKPDNRLYSAIYRFLTVKPNLDLSQVPEFYKLFNSTDIEHRIQRSWILSLVGEGLQSSLDFHLCQKLYLFTILLPYYSSPISIESEKVKILQIVLAAVKIFSSARTLCQSGLLTWLYSAIKNSESDEIVIISTLNDVMHMLWHTSFGNTIVEPDKDESTISQTCENADNNEQCEESYVKKKSTYSSFPSEFLLTHFGFIQKLGLLNTIDLLKYLETLLSVLRVQSAHTESPFVRAMSPLTFNHASVLARHWQQFYESQPNSSDKNHEENDSTTTHANMHQHFSEILMFWMPPRKQLPVGIQTDVVVSLCIDISFLTLKHLSHDTDVIDRFSHWLLKCLNEDITHGLSQSLCSPDVKPSYCAHIILGLYEASSAVRTDKCKGAFLRSSTWAEVCLRLNHSQYIKRQQSILQSFFQKKS